jgi:hypothetical protein
MLSWRAQQQAHHSPSRNMSPVLAGTEFKIDCIHLNELAGMCQTPRIVLHRDEERGQTKRACISSLSMPHMLHIPVTLAFTGFCSYSIHGVLNKDLILAPKKTLRYLFFICYKGGYFSLVYRKQ